MNWDNFSKHLKNFKLQMEPPPFQNREARLQKDHNWSILNWIFGKFSDAIDDLSEGMRDKFTDYDNRFNDQMNQTTSIDEVINARRPQNQEAFDTLGDREESQDRATKNLQNLHNDLAQNVMKVNESSGFNKISVQAIQPRSSDSAVKAYVAQTGQVDPRTGLLYFAEQTDAAGTQTINEYDSKTHELKRSRSLGITETVWLQGNSLFHDPNNNALCFILPKDHNSHWAVYNFDNDSWGDTFDMDGVYTYCVDAENKYFVTLQNPYDNRDYETPLGFNIYDLSSVIVSSPQFVKFVPVKANVVQGSNKIQGFTMIGDYIYLGRGASTSLEWFRTTVIDINGALISDYHWDTQSVVDYLNQQILGHTITDIESEGMSTNYINGEYVPVMIALGIGKDSNNKEVVDYLLLNLNDPDGTSINYTAGISTAQLTKAESTGVYAGLPIITGGAGTTSILDLAVKIKQPGLYNFTATIGNKGLSRFAKSVAGIINVKEATDGKANKIAINAIDYDGMQWSNYYDSTGPSGGDEIKHGWVGWASDSNRIIDARDALFKFDPFTAPAGTYVTQSNSNSPTGSQTKVYEIKTSNTLNYRTVTCFDPLENKVFIVAKYPGDSNNWKTII